MRIECGNISVLINKLIAYCVELSNIDKNSYQIIKFTLANFKDSIEQLKKTGFITERNYELFHKLISIYNNNNDSIEDDLKEIFKNELTKKYNIHIDERILENTKFEIKENEIYIYNIEIESTTYLRINGSWINGEEILFQQKTQK